MLIMKEMYVKIVTSNFKKGFSYLLENLNIPLINVGRRFVRGFWDDLNGALVYIKRVSEKT